MCQHVLKVMSHTGGERELVKPWVPCGFVRKPEDVEATCLPQSRALNAPWLFKAAEGHGRIHWSLGRLSSPGQ